jgi:hypothetical protein
MVSISSGASVIRGLLHCFIISDPGTNCILAGRSIGVKGRAVPSQPCLELAVLVHLYMICV